MAAVGRIGWKNGAGEGPDFEIRTIYDLIDVIELRPAIWLGCRSITRFDSFLHGWGAAAHAYGIEMETESPPLYEFHGFVSRHYKWGEWSPSGWCTIILQENNGDEELAFKKCMELLKQYRNK